MKIGEIIKEYKLLSSFFTKKIKTKGDKKSTDDQYINSQLNPLITKVNHFINLQPIIQKRMDTANVNNITIALPKSIPPVKNVTAEIPNKTWEIEINTFDQYASSLEESFCGIL